MEFHTDAVITQGEWAGWREDRQDAFENLVGPFYWRVEDDGTVRCAFRAEARHMNGSGFMHGGCLMTFADYAMFRIAGDSVVDGQTVTAAFTSQFLGTVPPGALVECTGEVSKAGKSLVFVRGDLTVKGEAVFSFTGVLKKTKPRV